MWNGLEWSVNEVFQCSARPDDFLNNNKLQLYMQMDLYNILRGSTKNEEDCIWDYNILLN